MHSLGPCDLIGQSEGRAGSAGLAEEINERGAQYGIIEKTPVGPQPLSAIVPPSAEQRYSIDHMRYFM